MNKYLKKCIAVVLMSLMCFGGVAPLIFENTAYALEAKNSTFDTVYKKTTEYLAKKELKYGSEWYAIALSRAGEKVDNSYYVSLLEAIYNGTPSVANNSKAIMALTSMGKPVSDELLAPFASFSAVSNLYITSIASALLALDTNGYEIPISENADDQNTREKMVDFLLSSLKDNSIYDYGIDSAAMIVQALAPYCDDDRIKAVTDEAIEKMKVIVETNVSQGSDLCSSYAQLIIALSEHSLDSSQWVGKMLTYYCEEDGAFLYNGKVNDFSTYQAHMALTAYKRYIENRNSLYNMNDGYFKITDKGNNGYSIYSPIRTEITVFMVNYNEDLTIKNIVSENINVLANSENPINTDCDKIIVWDSTENMIPLCEVK